MAAVCDICGKGPGFGNRVSHSHRRTPRRWNPNIQVVLAVSGQAGPPSGCTFNGRTCQMGQTGDHSRPEGSQPQEWQQQPGGRQPGGFSGR